MKKRFLLDMHLKKVPLHDSVYSAGGAFQPEERRKSHFEGEKTK
jgi:hypothetical protein